MAKKFVLRWRVGYTAMIRKAIVIVSDEDAWRLRNRPYYVEYKGDVPDHVAHNTDSGRTKYILAREIMGARQGDTVVHLNCDALDCRRSNLSLVKKGEKPPRRKYRERVTADKSS